MTAAVAIMFWIYFLSHSKNNQVTVKSDTPAYFFKNEHNQNSDVISFTTDTTCRSCTDKASCLNNANVTVQPQDNVVGYNNCVPSHCNESGCHQLNARCTPPTLRHHFTSHSCSCISQCVTVTVKTRNRLHLVVQLIKSAWQYYPNLRFVIVDEYDKTNGVNFPKEWLDMVQETNLITHLSTRPGVGFGRRLATLVAETPYVLISDDDFIFTEQTDLQKMLCILETTDIGIVGGVTDDGFPFDGLFKVHEDQRSSTSSAVLFVYPGVFYSYLPCFDNCRQADIIKNFFLADKSVILSAGSWDVFRLFFEHEDFFFQMRAAHVRVASCADIRVHHNTADRSLAVLRSNNYPQWRRHLLDKWLLSDYMYCFDKDSYLNNQYCRSYSPFSR